MNSGTTRLPRLAVASLVGAVMLLLAVGAASAHERRTVGDYQLTVGFLSEPAIVEELNGLDLRVQKGQGTDGTPVEGLANTLKGEVKFGDKTMPLTIAATFGTPGSYRASFIPTAEGAYTFHITGTIEGNQINESFTSGPNTFAEVGSRTTMSFPNQVNPVGMVAKTAQDAKDSASSARMLGIAGIVVGALGLIVGAAGLMMARNARAASPGAAPVQREVGGSPAGSQ